MTLTSTPSVHDGVGSGHNHVATECTGRPPSPICTNDAYMYMVRVVQLT